eukprot:CAMPEP_0183711762 /NCGR_PEP_ID=MMETSP0737-20130205/7171_1 /TAXON_ID=385413 /ORGANISM="Thalassiosira miniscula, Strain CCMP1093" /LENGTH=624 /DNA_ID=CAMNT_0025940329 /DNA_START=152 /DNA_END=2023 /DNA_ORIENTATION=-
MNSRHRRLRLTSLQQSSPCSASIFLSTLLLLHAFHHQILQDATFFFVRAEFNFEVGKRIHERVADFLGPPTAIVLQLQHYRINGVFPEKLGATDRDSFFRVNGALMETYPQFESIYYGMEDGVFALTSNEKSANYREPGHSGYMIIMDDDRGDATMGEADMGSSSSGRAKDETMEKHYGACVDYSSGEEVPCLMKAGGKYTECTAIALTQSSGEGREESPLFDCALEKCTDEASQRNCDELTNATERSSCLSDIKWCSSYIIKEAFDNETLGYISRGTYCIDHTGVPSQTRGEVVKKDKKEWGDCYFKDETTLVQRDREGDFAYCGGDGKVCNVTFFGAYSSKDYDPRWRGWYIETKKIQRPNWSPPYPFFSSLAIGLTFSAPIYSMQGDRNVFAGVLALDATLNDLTRFLQTNYMETPTVVAIFEQKEPHYMIASSTGSNSAKTVLVEDETKPCPFDAEGRNVFCKVARFNALDLKSSKNEMDHIIASAFLRQKEEGFPIDKLVSASTNKKNTLYATQTKPFSIEDASLDWAIMIMTPMEAKGSDQIVKGDDSFGVLIAVTTLGFAICAFLTGILIRYRKKRDIIFHDWRFMSAFVGGCALLNASCLSFLGPNTDALCLTRMW